MSSLSLPRESAFDSCDISHITFEVGAIDGAFGTPMGEGAISSFEFIYNGEVITLFFISAFSHVFVAR